MNGGNKYYFEIMIGTILLNFLMHVRICNPCKPLIQLPFNVMFLIFQIVTIGKQSKDVTKHYLMVLVCSVFVFPLMWS